MIYGVQRIECTAGGRLTIDVQVGLRGVAPGAGVVAGALYLLRAFGGRRRARGPVRHGPAVGSVRAPQEQEEQSARHAHGAQANEEDLSAAQVHVHLAVEEQRHEQGTRK